MENLLPLFKAIKSDFCNIVNYKLRGTTIEIITGIQTITNAVVSIFVSYKDGKIVVSDGGWINEGEYETYYAEHDSDEVIDLVVSQYTSYFDIKSVRSNSGTVYYYKSTDRIEHLSSIAHDVAHFIAYTVSAQHTTYRITNEEKTQKTVFTNQVNNALKSQFGDRNVFTNEYIKLKDEQSVKINSVVRIIHRDIYKQFYLMYVSGSRLDAFIKDATEATSKFQLIDQFGVKDSYLQKIAVLNKSAAGYNPQKSGIFLKQLEETTGRPLIEIDANTSMRNLLDALPHN
ncbi:hypothetical protein DYU11_20245 [Fibrisoma montanum]|uniref:DUF1828 domain-containing protein n=1 Tax=Fibrisoma montanum TaxID=2305895 RepID=A0A418M3Z6_9BACT|nr:hypothetical protein [Fibrisoma montanum]RIV20384.1 hypothetical protein DYU11_20245 [Fibrisoma montanum]